MFGITNIEMVLLTLWGKSIRVIPLRKQYLYLENNFHIIENNIMVLLQYKQRERKPNKIIELFGMKRFVSESGFIDYDQEEEIQESMVTKRIKELKSFTNRKYHSFSIINLVN
jgi:hypothetical protein